MEPEGDLIVKCICRCPEQLILSHNVWEPFSSWVARQKLYWGHFYHLPLLPSTMTLPNPPSVQEKPNKPHQWELLHHPQSLGWIMLYHSPNHPDSSHPQWLFLELFLCCHALRCKLNIWRPFCLLSSGRELVSVLIILSMYWSLHWG